MLVPRTYRLRLIIYIALLLSFLVGVLVLSYRASSEIVLREADANLARLAQQLGGQIKIEASDLLERAKMVRDSTSFQEYLFIAISLDTETGALREQFSRQFGWMQIDRTIVLARNGRAIYGDQHRDLSALLIERGLHKASDERLLYIDRADAVEMVAIAPIYYRSQYLGLVAVTKVLGAGWMAQVRGITDGDLLLVKNEKALASTLKDLPLGQRFPAGAERIDIGTEPYVVKHIALGNGLQVGELWFVLSQAELTTRLADQRNLVLGLAAGGALAILIVGLLMLRNFSAPLTRLIGDIQAVSDGRFPEMPEGHARDEMGYLAKQFAGMVNRLRDKQSEIARVQAQLEEQATTDALTGCYNRHYLYDIFPKLWSEAMRQDKRLSVLLIDLDLFKQVNDEYGHLAGDEVLRQFAQVLKSGTRVSDFLFRLGGEEFLVLTQGDIEGAQIMAEKIRAAVAGTATHHDGHTMRVTVSIGVAQAEPSDGLKGISAVLTRADHALYAAKEAGRDRVAVYEDRLRRRA